MPRMRHPNVTGAYDAHEDQVSQLRMTGWLTDDEWARAGYPEPPEPEPEPEDDKPEDKPAAAGEQEPKTPRRARSRATSDEESN